ncbi:acyltransferase family protein [Verrucosispora sioxanthis]|uniref:acyltransferase family protein n=1 Tax=Verrucosispora sioxanthis TaxID=2499994 RepID=UPI001C123BA0|nr:acyltransferase family protein [Verrucosispora sioxanthis]
MSGRHIAHWPVRDPLVDGLRAFAVAAVVLGHWLVTGLVLDEEGALNLASPLTAMPALAPASWVLQTLGLFFFAAGHASARSADRHPGVGWVRHRLRRLLLPAVALLGTGSAVLLAAAVAGVADDTLSVALTLAISPLWFLAPLLALVVLTGPLRAAVRRWGDGRLSRRRDARWLAYTGAVGLAAVLALGYPASAVGVPGEGRSNLDPPSLLVVALAVTQTGLGLLARPTLVRLLSRPLPRRLTGEINRHAVRVYLWHQPVLVAVVVLAAHGGTALPGLHTVPDDSRWLLARIGWLPVLTAVLVLLVRRGGPRLATAPVGGGSGPMNGRGPSAGRPSAPGVPAGCTMIDVCGSLGGPRRPGTRPQEVIAVRDSDPPSRGRADRQPR